MFTIQVETFDKYPNIKLIRNGDKYKIYNEETNKFLINTRPEGTCFEWIKTLPTWETKTIFEWYPSFAKRIVLNLYGE